MIVKYCHSLIQLTPHHCVRLVFELLNKELEECGFADQLIRKNAFHSLIEMLPDPIELQGGPSIFEIIPHKQKSMVFGW